MEEIEEISFKMIAAIGEAKSFIVESVNIANKGDIAAAREELAKTSEKLADAHHEHFDVITKEANGEKIDLGLLFVHAEDQLMTTALMKDMADQMITLYEKVYELTSK